MRIAVTGGKGGTGKSTTATALAIELARERKVLLADADVDCPNDHLILSVEREKVRDVFQRIPEWDASKCIKCGKCSEVCKQNAIVFVKNRLPIFIPEQCSGCGACFIVCPTKAISEARKKIGTIYSGSNYGVDLVSGELEINQPISEFVVSAMKDYINQIEKKYGYVLIDTSVGTHCQVISSLLGCDLALAVTEPTPLGAHDLELILRLLKILELPVKVVLNKASIGNKELIYSIVNRYGTEIITEIPYKKSILEAYSKGEPVKDEAIRKIVEFMEMGK